MVNELIQGDGSVNPAPVLSDTNTAVSPKPTMSALPSPFTSPSIRGKLSSFAQLPMVGQYCAIHLDSGAKVFPWLSATYTPSLAKPTISALPSPLTSAKRRGKELLEVQPPADEPEPKAASTG